MNLQSIMHGKIAAPFRLLLHGIEGVGKSTFAAASPSPIFIQTEDGLGQIDVPRFPLCESFRDVIECLDSLDDKHEFKTVIIDSLDWLQKLAERELLATKFKSKDHSITTTLVDVAAYYAGYKSLVPLFGEVINRLEILRKRGMNVVTIAHSKIGKINDPNGNSYDEFAPRLYKDINATMREWHDIIAFAHYRVFAAQEVEQKAFGKSTKTVAKLAKEGGTNRMLTLANSVAYASKCRYSLPDTMPLDGDAFFAEIWNQIHGTTE